MLDKSKFGKFFKELRLEKGVNQYVMADLLEIRQGMVCQYELGSRLPGFEILYKMWKIGVSLDDLMEYMSEE